MLILIALYGFFQSRASLLYMGLMELGFKGIVLQSR